MAEALNDPQKRAWRSFADQARRAGLGRAAPADPADVDALAEAVATAGATLQRALKKAESELQSLGKETAKADAIEENIESAWRRVEDACRKVEADLKGSTTLRTRLDEGRRSMMPKVERLVRERLEPVVTVKRRRIEAKLDPAGLSELHEELPKWVAAWSRYVFQWLELDMQRDLEIAWSPREGHLPISAPAFSALQPPDIAKEIAFPEIQVGRDMTGMAGAMARQARSVIYGLLSLTFLFGISRANIPWWVYVLVGVGAMGYGYLQANEERRKDGNRVEQELRQKADQATWNAVKVWLDRSQDRLVESVREQLHSRRAEFVEWYRREVIPRREERRRESNQRAKRAEKARFRIPKVQEEQRNIQRTVTALEAVERTMSAAQGGDA